jgi:tetratricopeptide (TPR) repeat protein
LLGSIYQKKGLLFLAVDEFRTALQMDPELPEAYLGLAQMLMDTNELENASTLLEKARVKFPNATEFMVSQALVLLRLQKPGQAEELLKQALALKPDNGLILFHLGRAYQQENNFPEAIHYWKETVRVDPSMAEAYNYLAYLHAEQGSHLDQAKGWIDKALALDPDNGFYLDTAGWIDFQKKNYPQALRQTLKARDAMQAAHQPVDPVVYEHMGDIYFEMKNYPEAQRSWQLALASDPKNAGIQGKLSRLPSPEGKQKP